MECRRAEFSCAHPLNRSEREGGGERKREGEKESNSKREREREREREIEMYNMVFELLNLFHCF